MPLRVEPSDVASSASAAIASGESVRWTSFRLRAALSVVVERDVTAPGRTAASAVEMRLTSRTRLRGCDGTRDTGDRGRSRSTSGCARACPSDRAAAPRGCAYAPAGLRRRCRVRSRRHLDQRDHARPAGQKPHCRRGRHPGLDQSHVISALDHCATGALDHCATGAATGCSVGAGLLHVTRVHADSIYSAVRDDPPSPTHHQCAHEIPPAASTRMPRSSVRIVRSRAPSQRRT